MSVNTPKRLKTTYYPGMGYAEERNEEANFGVCDAQTINSADPYANPDLSYLPNGHSIWPWNHSVLQPSLDQGPLNTVLSPSSSCGSPEGQGLSVAAPKTPSTTTKDHQHGGCMMQQFPTPTTSCNAQDHLSLSSSGGREHKRGRPRSESLTNLMIEGSTSPSAIKCKFCNRVFPREKSLAAHLRTHTGERPYVCDYPGCTKSFTQSGQMKTHQRLHTGERPFICAVPNCEMRFTHANRHCPVHVHSQLKRDDKFVVKMTPEQNEEVLRWLEKYRAEREDKSTPTRKTPQRSHHQSNNRRANTTPVSSGKTKSGHSLDGSAQKENLPHTPVQGKTTPTNGHHHHHLQSKDENSESNSSGGLKRHQNDENECPVTPSTPSNNPYKSRKGLMVELDMNAGLAFSPLAPLKMKPQPKLIQWQEPLSQGEEEEEDEDEAGGCKYYQNEESHNVNQHQIQQLQQQKEMKENLPLNRNYYSPSKKAAKQNTSTFNPKKKWLREACMDDLARPLDQTGSNGVLGSPQKLQIKSLNLLRPTVLMLASKDKLMPLNGANGVEEKQDGNGVVEGTASSALPVPDLAAVDSNKKWLGAMALMQLATEEAAAAKDRQDGTLTSLTPAVSVAVTNGQIMPEYTQL